MTVRNRKLSIPFEADTALLNDPFFGFETLNVEEIEIILCIQWFTSSLGRRNKHGSGAVGLRSER